MPTASPWNEKVVAEFRANGGMVGGGYSGYLMILVHSVGAKSGIARINPMVYQAVGEDFAVFASKRGATRHPDWYYNLKANPDTMIEIGTGAGIGAGNGTGNDTGNDTGNHAETETVEVRARETEGEERSRIWAAQKTAMPIFREYEAVAGRVIPVLLLERVPSAPPA